MKWEVRMLADIEFSETPTLKEETGPKGDLCSSDHNTRAAVYRGVVLTGSKNCAKKNTSSNCANHKKTVLWSTAAVHVPPCSSFVLSVAPFLSNFFSICDHKQKGDEEWADWTQFVLPVSRIICVKDITDEGGTFISSAPMAFKFAMHVLGVGCCRFNLSLERLQKLCKEELTLFFELILMHDSFSRWTSILASTDMFTSHWAARLIHLPVKSCMWSPGRPGVLWDLGTLPFFSLFPKFCEIWERPRDLGFAKSPATPEGKKACSAQSDCDWCTFNASYLWGKWSINKFLGRNVLSYVWLPHFFIVLLLRQLHLES